jgi:hypothetical protein
MPQTTKEGALALAGESECPLLRKEEADEMGAAVWLKKFPGGYVIGVSDKLHDLLLWFTPDLATAETLCRRAATIRACGSPFGATTRDAGD